MIITTDGLQRRHVEARLVEIADVPAKLPDMIWIDALDQIHDTATGEVVIDTTVELPLAAGITSVDLAAGTACRYRVRGLPAGDRVVTVPAGEDPISFDELPEATE